MLSLHFPNTQTNFFQIPNISSRQLHLLITAHERDDLNSYCELDSCPINKQLKENNGYNEMKNVNIHDCIQHLKSSCIHCLNDKNINDTHLQNQEETNMYEKQYEQFCQHYESQNFKYNKKQNALLPRYILGI